MHGTLGLRYSNSWPSTKPVARNGCAYWVYATLFCLCVFLASVQCLATTSVASLRCSCRPPPSSHIPFCCTSFVCRTLSGSLGMVAQVLDTAAQALDLAAQTTKISSRKLVLP